MDLTTTYLGLKLPSPLMPSASPLSDEVSNIRRMEDAGAAVVLHSLFEEQLALERFELHHRLTQGIESFPEALTYFPEAAQYCLGPENYLEHIQRAKEAVDIPIIGSLNGSSLGGWTEFAAQIEQAGADALELNIYSIPTDFDMTGEQVEQRYVDIVSAVRSATTLPVAVKIAPFFSNMANMAKKLEAAGANALVLFNRFYQPDIDLDTLEIRPNVLLSTPQALRLPLTWIGILYGRVKCDLAATSGIHTGHDALKMLMVGANVTMMASTLFQRGVGTIAEVEREMRQWMEENEYSSVEQMRGSMSQMLCPDPGAFERAQYMKALKNYHPAR